MSVQFVKNGTNVLVTIGTSVMSAPGNAFVKPDPRDENFIVISEKADPQSELDGIRIHVPDVTAPVAADRNDLITQLSTDFFFRVGAINSAAGMVVPDSATGLKFRIIMRDSAICFDKELTALGFAGVVNVDWKESGSFGSDV